ncbi:MAG TPA: YihY/virulence factor BrkB family protein [Chthoniobacterales bacterium]
MAKTEQSFLGTLTPRHLWELLVRTFNEWLEDKAPQLGAALAYYTVFSLAPLILVLLAIVGVIFRNDPAGAWERITEQMRYYLDPSGVQVVQDIARTAAKPSAGFWASVIGIALALFGASGVFGQLQDALNTIWGVKAKPAAAIWDYLRVRFLSFAMVAGVCFLLLVSLTVEALLKSFSGYLEAALPGGAALGFAIYMSVDLCLVVFVFAAMFKYLPDVEVRWRDVTVGAAVTALLFLVGKWGLGLYLGSGAASSAYGAASSLVTLLLWIYYSSQILLFGAEFTQVYANRFGAGGKPSKHAVAVKAIEKEISAPGEKPVHA